MTEAADRQTGAPPRPGRTDAAAARRALAALHGAYFVASGLWPILHMSSFELVTGRKRDHWLVKTVGALATAMGAALLLSARHGPSDDARALGIASGVAFGLVDVVYVTDGTLRPVYLLDAVAEAGLVAGWLAVGGDRRARGERPSAGSLSLPSTPSPSGVAVSRPRAAPSADAGAAEGSGSPEGTPRRRTR